MKRLRLFNTFYTSSRHIVGKFFIYTDRNIFRVFRNGFEVSEGFNYREVERFLK